MRCPQRRARKVDMQRSNRELWLAFLACLVIGLVYLGAVILLDGIPHASDLFGHGLGVLGFLLMLVTETLYSLRKRRHGARWGKMSSWLSFHIFTGIVGPFMVLLHTSWKSNGLAGLALWMTGLIVLSGFIGRYIYTLIPRTAEGAELEAEWLRESIATTQQSLDHWVVVHPQEAAALLALLGLEINPAEGETSAAGSAPPSSPLLVAQMVKLLADRRRPGWRLRLAWARRTLPPAARRALRQVDELVQRQRLLQRQIASLARARRWFSLWHAVHIPLGLALFTAAFIHSGAAFYYATLLR